MEQFPTEFTILQRLFLLEKEVAKLSEDIAIVQRDIGYFQVSDPSTLKRLKESH